MHPQLETALSPPFTSPFPEQAGDQAAMSRQTSVAHLFWEASFPGRTAPLKKHSTTSPRYQVLSTAGAFTHKDGRFHLDKPPRHCGSNLVRAWHTMAHSTQLVLAKSSLQRFQMTDSIRPLQEHRSQQAEQPFPGGP